MNCLKLRFIASCLAVIWLTPVAVYADSYTIYDNDASAYYGGGDIRHPDGSQAVYSNGDPVLHYSADVLGGSSYAVDTLTVTRGSDSFTATLTGAYFSSNVSEWVGDLFLTTGTWDPAGTGPNFIGNNATATGTTWNYVLSITGGPVNPDGSASSGDIALYVVSKDNILTTDQVHQTNFYRADQEFQYDTTGQTSIALGTWTLDPNGSFTFSLNNVDLAGLGLNGTLGLHWTMSCGNDVIEGAVPPAGTVPEPATLLLFGVGLAGLAVYRGRRKE